MPLMAMLAGARVWLGMLPVGGGARPMFTGRRAGGPGEGSGAGVVPGRPWASAAITVLPENIVQKDYRRQSERTYRNIKETTKHGI